MSLEDAQTSWGDVPALQRKKKGFVTHRRVQVRQWCMCHKKCLEGRKKTYNSMGKGWSGRIEMGWFFSFEASEKEGCTVQCWDME